MFRTDGADNKATLGTPPATGTVGYHKDNETEGGPTQGTNVTAWFLNSVQEELADVIETIGGLTLDKADVNQLTTTLAVRVLAILSNLTDTGAVTTAHGRIVIASQLAQSAGARTAVMASDRGSATSAATESAVIASKAQAGGDAEVAGDRALIAASNGTTLAKVTVDSTSTETAVIGAINTQVTGGKRTVVLGAEDGTAGGNTNGGQLLAACGKDGASTAPSVAGDNAATIAVAGNAKATGNMSVAVACRAGASGYVDVSSSEAGAAIACGSGAGTIQVDVSGNRSAAIGVTGDIDVQAGVVVASDFGAGPIAHNVANSLAGGNSSGIQWQLKSSDGRADFQLVFVNNIKTGATQAGAGAAAGELWATASHATLPDNVVLVGV